jgi:hypothetical protein
MINLYTVILMHQHNLNPTHARTLIATPICIFNSQI